ncbi:hypothetical protein G6O69_06530 [Pseudenhygromyxa sp. WMMC2535]|uniref:hypothetical protein n=1 Tax=Pseudenhygromyxa sp. WMMC2535 TaxID=2712867 RepID=UPI001595666F|nr:hypothetical protein [Pseudenhygromyxa sp. WMMC2535]NVB37481.1 hypothetical protein [Pseudenhygromyxa sp. WMMC2535]
MTEYISRDEVLGLPRPAATDDSAPTTMFSREDFAPTAPTKARATPAWPHGPLPAKSEETR